MADKEIKVLGKKADDLLFGEEPEELEQSSWFPKEDGSDVPTSDSEKDGAVEISLPFDDEFTKELMLTMFSKADDVRQAENERYTIAIQEGQKRLELKDALNNLTARGNATAERLRDSTGRLCELITNTEVTKDVEKLKEKIDHDIDVMIYLIYGLADK